MNDSLNSSIKNNEEQQTAIEQLWGDSLKKLTPKQRELVLDILKNMKNRARRAVFSN